MTPIPAKVLAVAKQSSRYHVLVQIELERYSRFIPHLKIRRKQTVPGLVTDSQLHVFSTTMPAKAGQPFPLWTVGERANIALYRHSVGPLTNVTSDPDRPPNFSRGRHIARKKD